MKLQRLICACLDVHTCASIMCVHASIICLHVYLCFCHRCMWSSIVCAFLHMCTSTTWVFMSVFPLCVCIFFHCMPIDVLTSASMCVCTYVHVSIVMCVPELCTPHMCMCPYKCACVPITCACACLLPLYVPASSMCACMCACFPRHVHICAYPIMCMGLYLCVYALLTSHVHIHSCAYVSFHHKGACLPDVCRCASVCLTCAYTCLCMYVPPSHCVQACTSACTCLHCALHVCACDGGGHGYLRWVRKGEAPEGA